MDVVAVAEGTTVPSPPPPARGRSRLALAVGDAVLCLSIADFLIHAAAVAARDLGRIACGEQCLLVSAAASVVSVSGEFMVGALGAIFVVFASRLGLGASDESVEEVPDAGKLEAAGREVMPPVTQWTLVIGLFFFLTIAAVGDLLKDRSPVKGSAMEQIGSVFTVVGILGLGVLSLVFIPIIALRLWRVIRPGWRCNAGVEAPAPVNLAAAWREALRDPVVIAVFSSMAFVLPLLVGLQVKGDSPVKGSRRERVGSVIYNVGVLGMDTLNCLFVCPLLTVRIWRAFRMA